MSSRLAGIHVLIRCSFQEDLRGRGKECTVLGGTHHSITGNNVLEKSDLQPVLKALKDRLMSKNVAEEIAEKLCESIAASLESKKQGFFTRISSTVQTAMEEALLHILTPRHSIDILKDVHAAEECGRPYVIVFVRVNKWSWQILESCKGCLLASPAQSHCNTCSL